jgi:diguanylate cyclase (GGDEF)-like protein
MLIESVGIHCFRKTLRIDHNEVNGACHEKIYLSLSFNLDVSYCFFPVNCYARDGKKVIRVGFYTMDNYQECDENGNYSGYFVDYLREISQYTGWEYEFIQMNYSACLKSLNDRNIDLVCGVDYSSFRTSTLDFSAQPAVTTHYELYALKDNDTYYYNDYADFDGMSIGVLASCNHLDALDDYAAAHHFSFEKQYFGNTAQLEKALEDNTVDAIYATNVSHPSEKKILASLPSFPLYFVTFKGNPIMEDLNSAQAVILDVNPNFDHDLYTTYQQDIRNYRCEFTRDELDYLSTAPEITVTCDPSKAPIEFYNENTQTVSGIAADVLDLVSQYTGLHFRYIKSDSFSDALAKLQSHEIDILTALAHDYAWSEQNQAFLSTPYLNSSIVVVRNNKTKSHERNIVALPHSFNLTNSILDNPEYDTEDVVYYDTIEECFQAVLSGSADCTYANSYNSSYLLSQVKYRNLSSTTLTAMTEDVSFGLSDQCDPRLLSIINKGLACISSEQLDSIILQNCSYKEDPSLLTLVYAYPRISIAIILAVSMTLLSLLLGILLIHSRKTKEIRIMSETDALTGLYNRRAAEDHITRQMQEDGRNPGCVRPLISIDLDKFKQVNDTYGHLEGDALLIAVADTLRTSVRSSDIVGRIGGDEFVVYLSNVTDRQNAMAVAEKLCQVIRELSTMKKEWSNISASIGISFADHPNIKMEELYISADKAMYSAKENGRNQYQTL